MSVCVCVCVCAYMRARCVCVCALLFSDIAGIADNADDVDIALLEEEEEEEFMRIQRKRSSLFIGTYSVTTTLVSAFTQVKEKGTSLLSIFPGLYISPTPLLVVSACISCSPPYLLTRLIAISRVKEGSR